MVSLTLSGILIEGNLIAPDLTGEFLSGSIKGQTAADFGLAKTQKLEDEIAVAWGDAKAFWAAFERRLARLETTDKATSLTREYWVVPLLELLGYQPIYQAKAEVVENQTYSISHRVEAGENKPPVHIIGCRVKLEEKPPSGMPRLSAHALMQEYLNRTEHLWGMVTNGLQWRLLRDSSLMTRLTYIEFDLEQILNGDNFAEFGLFYRLFHRSRLPLGMEDADKCLLEFYHQEAIQQGGRVREHLRDGVERAISDLGTGFLQHPKNQELRDLIDNNLLKETDFYRQFLLLIYRLLFLMVAESRNLLLAGEDEEKARIYREYYSIERLRLLAERPSYRREGFQDVWQGLRVTFSLFDESWRGELLGLSPLNGDLFGSGTLKDLDSCAIDNHDLLCAIRQLSLYEQKGQWRRVNYGALDVEELGSVYESLLDFHPQVVRREGIYQFVLVAGTDRKTTGSYYTPPELVGQLIKSALEPVIEEKIRSSASGQKDGAEALLLTLKICDPACGSGHFLLAAARRIGRELAKVRTGGAQPTPDELRIAVRDVIQNCIYGVDLNPLAVDLCKVALWIEGFAKGLPLNFLDHRIKCGNSLVGVLNLSCLDEGIPDEAFKAVTGDDKKWATALKKQNKRERKTDLQGQLSLFDNLNTQRTEYGESWRKLGAIGEKTTQEVREKQRKYQENRQDSGWWRDYSACNLWTAAFFMPLTEQNLQLLPTTAALFRFVVGLQPNDALNCNYEPSINQVVDAANQLAEDKRFFHWPLEFPEVFEVGGFDCVLGNPPWELLQIAEKEFFASKDADIANAQNKAAREKLIKFLSQTNPKLLQEFEDAKHDADAQNKFIRESGRFPLTAVGKINTYAVFAETVRNLINNNGRCGIIVPTGIATDESNKLFIQKIVNQHQLNSFFDFTNRGYIFASVESTFSFCLLVLSPQNNQLYLASQLWKLADINNIFKSYNLTALEINKINPNTSNLPIFKSSIDAKFILKIYNNIPVLEDENKTNYWKLLFRQGLFNMTSDSYLFTTKSDLEGKGYTISKNLFIQKNDVYLPLYESKLTDIYNHRASTFEGIEESKMPGTKPKTNEFTLEQLTNPNEVILPRHWIEEKEVNRRIPDFWKRQWLLGFRNAISAVADSRSVRFTIIPRYGVGNSMPLIFPDKAVNDICGLLANFNSLILDYVAKQKASGGNLNFYVVKQLPIIPPETYKKEDIEFISSRVLELVYTAWDMQSFAQDMGYEGPPFIWNEQRRAILRAELDAYYAKLYGLTRDELRYILDPADVYGPDFPSETFRVLKNNEMKKFGEYRTQRLVLAAWDMLGF
jgi:type I restriction-modification system DNA methylase subunit